MAVAIADREAQLSGPEIRTARLRVLAVLMAVWAEATVVQAVSKEEVPFQAAAVREVRAFVAPPNGDHRTAPLLELGLRSIRAVVRLDQRPAPALRQRDPHLVPAQDEPAAARSVLTRTMSSGLPPNQERIASESPTARPFTSHSAPEFQASSGQSSFLSSQTALPRAKASPPSARPW